MYCTTHPLQRAAGQQVFVSWGFGRWDLSAFWVLAIAGIESRSFFGTPHPPNTTAQKGKQGKRPRMEADNHTPAAAGPKWESPTRNVTDTNVPNDNVPNDNTPHDNAPNGNVPNDDAPNNNATDTRVTDNKGPKEPHTHCSLCLSPEQIMTPATPDLGLEPTRTVTPNPTTATHDPKPAERSPAIPKPPNEGPQAKPPNETAERGSPKWNPGQ
ncbi:hypothetical protein BS47DRAFT_1360542 [Hydnum rufescens UP504]|uniref:Uncharacterized protein n=1 Tax=Hydnum rufescens UP504 TaxID=1448309 RepID=A0A9P6B2F1_9AGAM|nr:hypothetical protein BS47DRAFT_1360542 [Hydnum rufescens UP504]